VPLGYGLHAGQLFRGKGIGGDVVVVVGVAIGGAVVVGLAVGMGVAVGTGVAVAVVDDVNTLTPTKTALPNPTTSMPIAMTSIGPGPGESNCDVKAAVTAHSVKTGPASLAASSMVCPTRFWVFVCCVG
jgi:hypothetical protein